MSTGTLTVKAIKNDTVSLLYESENGKYSGEVSMPVKMWERMRDKEGKEYKDIKG